MRCVGEELTRDFRGNYQGSEIWLAQAWSGYMITNYATTKTTKG